MTLERPRAPKRVALNMKATPQLRGRIDDAARESGLSVAQEVERRLIESFNAETALGGRKTAAFLRSLAALFELAESSTGKSWHEDWETFAAVRKATMRTLLAHSPPTPAHVEEIAQRADQASAAWAEAWDRYNQRSGLLTPTVLNALSPFYGQQTVTLPDNDPLTNEPWTPAGLAEAKALMTEAATLLTAAQAARAELATAMEPVTEARQRGLLLADSILGDGQEEG